MSQIDVLRCLFMVPERIADAEVRKSPQEALLLWVVALAIAMTAGAGCSSSSNDAASPIADTATTGSAESPGTLGATTVTPTTGVTLPGAAPTGSPTTGPEPVGNASDASADAVLLASEYTLLDIGTPQEMVTLFSSTNVPEAHIATCMSSAGFQYLEDQDPEAMVASDLRNTMSAADYAAAHGLGITAPGTEQAPTTPQDPNSDYVSSLSKGQSDAYYQTLHGCREADRREVPIESIAHNVAIEQFRDVVATDDRGVAALAQWKSCVASAGFAFESPLAMREWFYVRMANGATPSSLHAEEVTVAVANVLCEAAYDTTLRDVIHARFDDFKALNATAWATGAEPEGQG